MPERGWWWARAKLDAKTVPTGKVTLAAAGGLSLVGTVVPALSGVFLDSAFVQLVGGAGGLGTVIAPTAFQNALVRDALNAILSGVGETASSTISPAVTSKLLAQWSIAAQTAAKALDHLATAAGAQVWRVLSDGTVWMGTEAWPAQSLPSTSDVLMQYPNEGRYEIGCQTPALLPGVKLSNVGVNVGAVDHYVEHDRVRSIAWAA
jgi:hypothetical protein